MIQKLAKITLVTALLLLIAACTQSAGPSVKGVWKLDVNQIDAFTYGSAAELEYLDLSDGSSAALYGKKSSVGLKTCTSWPVQTSSGSLTFFPGSAGEFSFFLTLSGDTLTLKDSNGKQATFSRVSAVPDASKCQSLAYASGPLAVNLSVDSWSNLTSDGSSLWVARAGDVYPVDPNTGTLGAAQHLTSGLYYHILAMQGADFWAIAAAGNNDVIKRMRIGDTEVDSVDTGVDLSSKMMLSAAAYGNGHLLLAGTSVASGKDGFLEVDSDTEPDGVLSQYDFDLTFEALAFRGNELWGLIRNPGGPQIVKLNSGSRSVAASYKLPELAEGDRYQGLAVLNNKFYLLAKEGGAYNLYSVEP